MKQIHTVLGIVYFFESADIVFNKSIVYNYILQIYNLDLCLHLVGRLLLFLTMFVTSYFRLLKVDTHLVPKYVGLLIYFMILTCHFIFQFIVNQLNLSS